MAKKNVKKEIDFIYILFLRREIMLRRFLLLVGCNIKMEQFIPYYAI